MITGGVPPPLYSPSFSVLVRCVNHYRFIVSKRLEVSCWERKKAITSTVFLPSQSCNVVSDWPYLNIVRKSWNSIYTIQKSLNLVTFNSKLLLHRNEILLKLYFQFAYKRQHMFYQLWHLYVTGHFKFWINSYEPVTAATSSHLYLFRSLSITLHICYI